LQKVTLPLAKTGAEFDQKDHLLATKNGVIDLQTGEFRAGQATDYITQSVDYAYDPYATAPRWKKFLDEIFKGDQT